MPWNSTKEFEKGTMQVLETNWENEDKKIIDSKNPTVPFKSSPMCNKSKAVVYCIIGKGEWQDDIYKKSI